MKHNSTNPENKLVRALGLFDSVGIVIGTIIGTGVFLKTANMSQATGNPYLVLLAWAVAGLLSFSGALKSGKAPASPTTRHASPAKKKKRDSTLLYRHTFHKFWKYKFKSAYFHKCYFHKKYNYRSSFFHKFAFCRKFKFFRMFR